MKKVKVTNRSNGFMGYFIPELNLRRSFGPNETKAIDEDELKKVMYQPGGQNLIDAYLLIDDKEVANEYSPIASQEPEYWMSKEKITDLMLNGSLDEFLDCLDYCPIGTLEMIKDLAVSIPLTDTNKMKAIQDKTGMNVYNAIQNKDEDNNSAVSGRSERRVRNNDSENKPLIQQKYRRVEPKID